jgi:hypothetical protein
MASSILRHLESLVQKNHSPLPLLENLYELFMKKDRIFFIGKKVAIN